MAKCLKNICQGEFHFVSLQSGSDWNYILWKQLENWTKYSKQLFSHTGQQATQTCDLQRKGDKWREHLHFLGSQPAGNSQTMTKEGKWKLAELKNQKSRRSRQLRLSQKGGSYKRKEFPGICILFLLSVWVDTSLSMCRVKSDKARKERLLRKKQLL